MLEPLSFRALASETYRYYPCEKLRLAEGSEKEIPRLWFSSPYSVPSTRDNNLVGTLSFTKTSLFYRLTSFEPRDRRAAFVIGELSIEVQHL